MPSMVDYFTAEFAFTVKVAFLGSIGGLLFGYDTAVISGAIGNLTEFFHLSPVETGWAISSALVGCLIGAFFILLNSYNFFPPT